MTVFQRGLGAGSLLLAFSLTTLAQPSASESTSSPEARAHALVSRMTLEEKISQLQSDAPAITRLDVPAYHWWNEALHGVARAGVATVFPQAIGLAATWDPALLHQAADVISTEARAKYNARGKSGSSMYGGLTFWSPNINIFRDPRWGRGQETYGEDPFLTGRMAVAFITGLQGNDPTYFKTIATPKHFAVHSGPEPIRHVFDARPPLRDLYETYLPAFEAAIVEGGAWSIMGAYNRVYGTPCCASDLLLGKILRDRWKFKGYVVSDCGAIYDMYTFHKVNKDAVDASAAGIAHGCDLTCGTEYEALSQSVAAGLVSEREIARSAERLMEARIRLGMFDPPENVPYSRIAPSANDAPSHDTLSRKVAGESIVLLKNSSRLLPLPSTPQRIAVIGPLADDRNVLLGNYNGTPSHPVTIIQGIRAGAPVGSRVVYARGSELATGRMTLDPIPSANLSTQKGKKIVRGLSAEYFPNMTLAGPAVVSRVDTTVAFEWGDGSPDTNIPADHFSARWTGTVRTEISGKRFLGFVVDDGARLWVNDSLFVEDWHTGSPRPVAREMFFEAGKSYSIRLEYFESGEGATAVLGWSTGDTNAGAEAVTLAQNSDVVIAVMGISPVLEGEEMRVQVPGFSGGDRTTLDIPEPQEQLLKRLVNTGKPVVLALVNGSALSIPWEAGNVPAILEAWYPGQEGGAAVADVLFGKTNPAGRLPVTFYSSVNDLPPFESYEMEGRTYRYFRGEPLYPFGFGLSYTAFAYGETSTDRTTYRDGDTIRVSLTVRNSGSRDGAEVVQVYARLAPADAGDPVMSLRAFQRVEIPRGENRKVGLAIPVRDLRVFDEHKNDYLVRPGRYEILVGASSRDVRSRTSFRVVT